MKWFLFCFFVCLQVHAKNFVTVISEENSLLKLHLNASKITTSTFKITTWNVQKIPSQNTLKDLKTILKHTDILLLQEAYASPSFLNLISQQKSFSVLMAQSFKDSTNTSTGVATFSRWAPDISVARQSPYMEPVLNTPKMSLIQYYNIPATNKTLLVINIHALNFVFNENFEEQIFVLLQYVGNHVGPVLFAGDFNTWNSSRLNFLNTALLNYNVKRIPIKSPQYLQLDHIYTRGLRVTRANCLENITSSDHLPLIAEVSLESP